MTIQKVLEQLKTADKPIARRLHKGKGFKVLILGFNKGMVLEDHKTNVSTILTVLEGSVYYNNGHSSTLLKKYEEYEIPNHEIHSVEAEEDSICLLTQGKRIQEWQPEEEEDPVEDLESGN
ncbi:hypothetical protein [Persicobacter diffluens]|uniref:Cupin n=1 Tax=Persicobacter diffluens TaxID=981 RepID=A0AAN4W1D2_9BACT|nr:hypothetical protein PEDI_30740 [Persicobacter diffluens]